MALPKINWDDPRVKGFEAFGRDGKEELSLELIDAIYDDDLDWSEESKKLCELRDSGGSLEITAYRRMVVKPEMFDPVEDIAYDIEERHALGAEPSSRFDTFTDEGLAEVKAAYDAFIAAFIKNYHVWACEPVAIIIVPVKELYNEVDASTREERFGEKAE
jgi:hypothetical protein